MDLTKPFKVASEPETIKTGVSVKNGKKIPWTLRKIKVEGLDIEPAGFDVVKPGDFVMITEKQNGDYTNYNYAKHEEEAGTPASSTPSTGGSDPRVLKLLVVIAEQMGVDKDVILDIVSS